MPDKLLSDSARPCALLCVSDGMLSRRTAIDQKLPGCSMAPCTEAP